MGKGETAHVALPLTQPQILSFNHAKEDSGEVEDVAERESTCLAYVKPWVQSPIRGRRNRNNCIMLSNFGEK